MTRRRKPKPRSAASVPSVTPEAAATTDVMTADEVATYLRVDRNTVYEFAGRGEIPHRRLGKRMIFRRGSIIAWLDAGAASADSQ